MTDKSSSNMVDNLLILTPKEVHKININIKKENKISERYTHLLKLSKDSPYYEFYDAMEDLQVDRVISDSDILSIKIWKYMDFLKENKKPVKPISILRKQENYKELERIMDDNNFIVIPKNKKNIKV